MGSCPCGKLWVGVGKSSLSTTSFPPAPQKSPIFPHAGARCISSPLRTFSSLCPTYMLMSSGPFTLWGREKRKPVRACPSTARRKSVPVRDPPILYLRNVMAHVVATAFASKVFPVPGGPYSSRPERHRPNDSSSGCSRGNWIVSRISFFTSWSPPTSCQDTEGICQERESTCQHFLLSPKHAWAALAPVGY